MKIRWTPILTATAATVGVAGLGYLAYRYFNAQPFLHPTVESKLPIAKDLYTVSDFVGNYDMDGVSFDTEGVIISSDAVKTIIIPI
jgi:hypothetical protein